jgi:hypothetical protein
MLVFPQGCSELPNVNTRCIGLSFALLAAPYRPLKEWHTLPRFVVRLARCTLPPIQRPTSKENTPSVHFGWLSLVACLPKILQMRPQFRWRLQRLCQLKPVRFIQRNAKLCHEHGTDIIHASQLPYDRKCILVKTRRSCDFQPVTSQCFLL